MKISLHDLNKQYHDGSRDLTILENVSYEFKEKKTTGIVGRSGIGKSTLLQIIGGLDKPTRGSVIFGETDLSKLSQDELSAFRGKNVGFVFQFHHLLSEFSALENVSMPLIIQGDDEEVASRDARDILERVGLKDRLMHRPSELSGGEQQRVAIARALVTQPAVLLADEPTGNLDAATAQVVHTLLLEVSRELSTTVIVATHSKELASTLDVTLEMQVGGRLLPTQR